MSRFSSGGGFCNASCSEGFGGRCWQSQKHAWVLLQLCGAFWVYWSIIMWLTHSKNDLVLVCFSLCFVWNCWSENARLDQSWSPDFESAVWSNKTRLASSSQLFHTSKSQNGVGSASASFHLLWTGLKEDDIQLEAVHTRLFPVVFSVSCLEL